MGWECMQIAVKTRMNKKGKQASCVGVGMSAGPVLVQFR